MQINELREFGDRRIRDLDIREHTVGGADDQNRRRWNCSAMRKMTSERYGGKTNVESEQVKERDFFHAGT